MAAPARKNAEAGSWRSDFRGVLRLGWPNSVNSMLTFLPGLVMLYFLNDNPDQVAGAGMGFMFHNVAGYSLIIGSGAGAQPLISQAFGAQNYLRCGELLQRQLAIHAVLIVIVAYVWLKTESILVFFKQPPAIAALAGEFVRWRVAALPALIIKEDLSYYLVAQRTVQLPMIASVVGGIVNMVLFVVLIPRFGFIGAPLAYTLANILQAFLLLAFTRRVLPNSTAWPQWSLGTSTAQWGELLKLALPGGIMQLCEWWGWEINLFFAGLLCGSDSQGGCVQLEVFPIVANTMVVGFMPNVGFSISAGAMIGNALGANDAAKARRIAIIALWIAAFIGGTVASALILSRQWWGFIFSKDPQVIDLTSRTVPVVAVYIFLDNLGPGALLNILRSISVVTLPAIINFVAFYALGIPFGLWLTFERPDEDWGIIGLWTGLSLGMFIMVTSLFIFLWCCVDWQQVADAAQSKALTTTQNEETPKLQLSEIEGVPLKLPQLERKVLGKSRYEGVSTEVQI